MSIILNEITNYNNINISESVISLDNYLDLICEQCNDILLEAGSDYKINKKDLTDPNKLKQILNKLEKDTMDPPEKQKIANRIITYIIGALLFTGFTGSALLFFKDILFSFLSFLATMYIARLSLEALSNRDIGYIKLINYTEKNIKKIESKLQSEKVPKNKKELEDKLNILKDVRQKLIDDHDRVVNIIRDNENLRKMKDAGFIKKIKLDNGSIDDYIKRLKKNISEENDQYKKKELQHYLKYLEKKSVLEKKIKQLEDKLKTVDNEKTAISIVNKIQSLNKELYGYEKEWNELFRELKGV